MYMVYYTSFISGEIVALCSHLSLSYEECSQPGTQPDYKKSQRCDQTAARFQ